MGSTPETPPPQTECPEHAGPFDGYAVRRCAHLGKSLAVVYQEHDCGGLHTVIYLRWAEGFPETSSRWAHEGTLAKDTPAALRAFDHYVGRMLAGDYPPFVEPRQNWTGATAIGCVA